MKYFPIYHLMNISLLIMSIGPIVPTEAVGWGLCPTLPGVTPFNQREFLGQWFEVERSFNLVEIIQSCISYEFTYNSAGRVDVVISNVNRWSKKLKYTNGTAFPLAKKSSTFMYKPKSIPFFAARFMPGTGMYKVLDTDYSNYAILWQCTNWTLTYTDTIWILGRTINITDTQRVQIYNKLVTFNLDPDRLILTKNENCSNNAYF